MTSRITIFAALALFAGSASADFFDFFDMGDFFGNNRGEQTQQANGTGQAANNGASKANGRSRGRGEADIKMDFDLNFRAKGFGMADAANKGQARNTVSSQYQASQLDTYGTGYNNAYNYVNSTPYNYYTYSYPYPYYNYYAPYTQPQQPYVQGYYYPQYYPQAYYLPPAQ